MSGLKIKNLYKEYLNQRFLDITFERFIYLVMIFPSLVVLKSDGEVDRKEREAINAIIKLIARQNTNSHLPEEEEENLSLIYKAEIRYLLKTQTLWENKFLNALHEYLSLDSEHLDFVQETMYIFAYASNGLCLEEKEALAYLHERLNLKPIE